MHVITDQNPKSGGFTIVELLIVIVVIGILAAISIVSYSGIQDRAQKTTIKSDLKNLTTAMTAARVQTGKVLGGVTGSFGTAGGCAGLASGTNLATLPHATDWCWLQYSGALNAISVASGINVRGLVDPYGRPYFIDENEGEGAPDDCDRDVIGAYPQPFVTGWVPMSGTFAYVANSLASC